MEFASGSSADAGGGIREEKGKEYSIGDDEGRQKQETVVEEPPMTNAERSKLEAGPSTFSTKKEEVDELETTKAKMGEVREENQRLKMSLNQIMNDYRTLQMQFHNIVQQEATKKSADDEGNDGHQDIIEESELVSLSLGRVPNNPRNNEKAIVSKPLKDEEYNEDLALGLDCKFETSKSGSTTEPLTNPSPVNSSEVPKGEAGETWPLSKALKTTREVGEDEVSQQNPAKKPRVCVRARCDTPTMNDGCQWRKYGQKIAKGNPCPRAYYRCTVGTSCPVRKQVQRCAEDMSILITTYEGTHNHPLPISATAMASTTSAAASMLLSGSSSSHSSSMPSTNTTTAAANLHGLNFYQSDSSRSKQIYLSNPVLTSSSSHPTITLDLTSNPSSSSSPFVRFTSNYNQPRYPSPSTSLMSFSSSESNAMSRSNGFLSYGTQPYISNRNILGSLNYGRQPMENIYQSYMQKNNNPTILPQGGTQHALPTDTIAAATKAITADPSFQSALAAALTSIIGTAGSGVIGSNQGINQGVGENNLAQKMKWVDMFPPTTSSSSSSSSSTLAASTTSKVNGCASSFLTNKTPANAQTGGLVFLSPSLPFSSSKSASAPPGDNRDNTN